MNKFLLLFLIVAAPLFGTDGVMKDASGSVYYPSAGIINHSEGTIQITATPFMDIKNIRNSWPFAVALSGRRNAPETRTALGIYCASGQLKDMYGLHALLRTSLGKSAGTVDRKSAVRAGQQVNMAITWGPAGFYFYVDGRLIGNKKYAGTMLPFAPFLRIGSDSPFFVSRVAVSSKQLPVKELDFDAATPFRADSECTLLANNLEKPQFFAGKVFRKNAFVSFQPFAGTAERIVYEDEIPVFNFIGNNLTEKEIVLPLEIDVAPFKGLAFHFSRQVRLPAGTIQKSFKVALPRLPAGFYTLHFRSGKLDIPGFSVSVQPRVAGRTGKLEEYLGTASCTEPEIMKKLGIRWVRSWGRADLQWFQVEPLPGVFDFRTADCMINAHLANGVKVLGVLGYPPLWAAERPKEWKNRYPYRADEPSRWKPRSHGEWSRYTDAVAKHFKGRVNHYEIYNECDFKAPGLPATFTGTNAEYYDLLVRAAKSIRSADPESKVLITGFSMIPNVCDTSMPEDLLKRGAGKIVDAWNLHSYRSLVNVPEMKKLVRSYRGDMPFWQTEHMWHIMKDKKRIAYLTPAINFWFLNEGFEKFFTFGWGEYLSDGHTFSPEVPLHAFGVCQQYLRICSAYMGTHPKLSASDFDVRHVLKTADGSFLTVVGSSAGDYALTIENSDAEIRDEHGRKVSVSGGVLELNGKLCYIRTREPLKIVQVRFLGGGQLLPNRGFEELGGDAMGGIEQCYPAEWILRKNYDPKSSITIDPKNGLGKYAVKLSTSGKGRVYLFSYLKITSPGIYRVSAHFRNVSGKAKPYISAYDTTVGAHYLVRKDFLVAPSDKFRKDTFEIEIRTVPRSTLAVIFGIDGGAGSVLLDDVEMVRIEREKFPVSEACPVLLSGVPVKKTVLRYDGVKIDISALSKLIGKQKKGGVLFDVRPSFAGVSTEKGSLPRDKYYTVPQGKYSEIHALVCSLYVPAEKGKLLAEILLRYTDGTEASLPIRVGVETADWCRRPKDAAKGLSSVCSVTLADHSDREIFLASWKNPFPGKTVKNFRFRVVEGGIVLLPGVTLRKNSR